MKFGIVTLVSDNYGNKYQNYAVEKLLSPFGDAETFGLEPLNTSRDTEHRSMLHKLSPSYIRDVLIYRTMYAFDINRVDKGVLHNLILSKMKSSELLALKKRRSEIFGEFAKSNIHISPIRLSRDNTDREWSNRFDYFICGSDQIWNPTYATTSELAFCTFAPEKTICLAPSFGVSQIPDSRKDEYAAYLRKLYRLSVRENAGQRIIKELTGRTAEVLIDPTMAVPTWTWEELCKKPKNVLPERYIVCYFLGKIDKAYMRRVKAFASKKQLPLVMLFDITMPEYYLFDPAEVLYVIKKAEYVLTDSFHGSVFSILFHKDFFAFDRNEGGSSMNSRLETLLEKFELEDRRTEEAGNISAERWNTVEQRLSTERKRMMDYLSAAIGKV